MNNLKKLREERSITQQELAKKIGVHYRTIQNLENGEVQIKSDKAKKLADYFGVDLGYLYGYQPIKVIQELIDENIFLRDENQRLNNDLNDVYTIVEDYRRKNHVAS
ncbi:hypothetical protein BKX95_08470 [Streptococcus iniae]|nr:hypothetical protein BKX95_08470 [Streptococcus iniae]